ncbi:MAG: RsmB/NOP family class I SAM-dependent RNA methyltransferase [Clostridiales bacterium]|nr:RsmB/NOP family class I SAM-dependent RNA methyltransferase [Clostridiales bacterium]
MQKLPEAFVERMKEMLGGEFEDYEASFEKPSYTGLRVNNRKLSTEQFEQISPFPLSRVPWTKNGFYYDGKDQPAKHPYYYAGLYYIQEPSAMTPAAILPVEPGDKVLDLCAAPGGKSTELAAKLNGTGVLVSNDISASRTKALLKNLELFGSDRCVVLNEVPDHLSQTFFEYFDKILIDAPCSGEGMFRKDAAIRKAWEKQGPDFYAKIQRSILDAAVQLLKPGGMMLYSTCTFSSVENEDSIIYALAKYPELSLVPVPKDYGFADGRVDLVSEEIPISEERKKTIANTARLWPFRIQGEGHFVALLKKEGECQRGSFEKKGIHPDFVKLPKEILDFLSHTGCSFEGYRPELHGERLFLIPEEIPDLKGLRVVRSGLFAGYDLKNRFEPSQAFAMTLDSSHWDNCLSLAASDPKVVKYLKGETLDLSEELKPGWVLVLVDGYPLGWGKYAKGRLKNKYLAGWRMM